MLFSKGKWVPVLLCVFCLLSSLTPQTSGAVTPLDDDTEFVNQVYRDFLNREPDAEGLAYWVSQLETEAINRTELVEQYLLCPEFGQTIAPVVRLYFTYYLRIPDYDGLMFWVNSYAAGMSLNDISDAFATAQEFIDRYGSVTNEEFISQMYVNVYGRQPDSEGLAYWKDMLDTLTLTRGQVMVEFSSAEEYLSISANQVYVTMTYMGLLRRAPEQGGFDYWVDVMNQGAAGLGLIGSFLDSEEYAARFPTAGDGFLDINLKACVDATGLPYDQITILICGNNVVDLSGIDNLENLTTLMLVSNQITDISPLQDLTHLGLLWLSFNEISDITSLQGLTNLTTLSLGWNQISDITPLQGLTNLTSLSLNSNRISDITPLQGLTNLTTLNLDWNQISDITPLQGLTSLTELNLTFNCISDFSPISELQIDDLSTELQNLYCD